MAYNDPQFLEGRQPRQAGKIRLRIGQQNGDKDDFGEAHMERESRLKDIQSAGFENARDFTEFVTNDYDAIYPNGAGLIIYKKGEKHNQLYVQLTPSKYGDFYDVKTGVASNRDQMKNKTPLWTKPTSGVEQSEKERAHANQSKGSSLRDLASNSDNSSIAEAPKKSIKDIRKAYENAKSVKGNSKTIHVGDEKIKCHYKLVEAETPTASHDEV